VFQTTSRLLPEHKERDLKDRIHKFRDQISSPTQSPLLTTPLGHIVNSFICENQSPAVPSVISSSFSDRTNTEIIDQIRSEVPCHWHNGFSNQAIVGAHSATELRPTYENGQSAQQMVLNDGVLITNADNSDPPNVMLGDIIIKHYLKIPVSNHPIQFPVYNSLSVPRA
jgi:hypothetical protein